jgi:hypothetical protein
VLIGVHLWFHPLRPSANQHPDKAIPAHVPILFLPGTEDDPRRDAKEREEEDMVDLVFLRVPWRHFADGFWLNRLDT